MNIAYFDCFSGAAGDMMLAALIDAGCPLEHLQDVVRKLSLPGVELTATVTERHWLRALHVDVKITPDASQKHRHLSDIERIIRAAPLDASIIDDSLKIFRRLAAAEAHVHDCKIEEVHFHEVGANDAIVDIVCHVAALRKLGVERVECSPIPPGSGAVKCDHGLMPVPAPAAAHLLRDTPIAACDEPGELCTPTGAAILTTLAERFGPPPNMHVTSVGVGAGTRRGVTRPNILRVFLGRVASDPRELEHDTVTVLEAQIDDMPAQGLAFTAERLLASGALDVYLVPILMKKGRPGSLLSVLCSPADADALERLIFAETTTFGVRKTSATRSKLRRRSEPVTTRFGEIRIKLGLRGNEVLQAAPEYEDCAAAARKHQVALRVVQEETLKAWRARGGS